MKKLQLFIAAISLSGLVGGQAIAQDMDDNRDKLKLGFKAGANYSNIYDTQGEDFLADGKVGFAAGGFVSIPIGTFIGVQPEILISQRGFQANGTILGSPYSLTRTTTFIDIPLLFVLKPLPFLNILVGPQFSYLAKQKTVFANAVTTVEQEQEFENEDYRKNMLCFTGGFDVNINHFTFGARAGWDVQNNNGNGTSTTPRYKNTWYQATIGYRLYSNN